jgi:phage terminase large subunit
MLLFEDFTYDRIMALIGYSSEHKIYQLNPALRDFWQVNKRNKVLHGGRASSKSHDAAGFAVYLAANFKIKFLCCRQFQNRIDESVYTLIKDKIENSDFDKEFEFTNTSIKHKITKSEFLFYGIARNLKEIKSTEGVDILWLEEANYLTDEQWEVLNPTVRKEGSQIWIIFNPDDYMDFAYQKFVVNPSDETEVRQINWQENPFLSKTMLKVIADEYKSDPKKAAHIYGGEPKMGMDKSVINLSYIMAAIDAHKKLGWEPIGAITTGFDIADDGDDLCASATAHGNVLVFVDEWEGLEDELLKSCTKVWTHARNTGGSITYDSIGVGAHAGAKFKELNDAHKLKISYDPFNAGSKVNDPDKIFMKLPHMNILNKDHFSNLKAQSWDEVAARFRKTHEAVTQGVKHPFDELVSIDSDKVPKHIIEKIKRELSAPRKDLDGNGRFKVESKKDMLTRGIKSPNIADAIIMALIKAKRKPAGFFDM